jgi:hypothetical protein
MAAILEPTIDRGPASESSDRSFGLVFAVLFAVVALWPLIYFELPRWWALGVALAFMAAALIRPQLLHHFNRAWLAFGRLLHRIVGPLVMGMIYFLCVTPTGLIMRLRRKNLLWLKRPPVKSYWIPRDELPPGAQSMRNQF